MSHSEKPRPYSYYPSIVLILSPIAAFLLVECFTHNPFIILTPKIAIWNILFYEMIYLLFFSLSHSFWFSCLLGDLLFFVIGLGNYYVVQFRSNPIVPWDIYSIRTAASVAGDFDYTPNAGAAVCILCFIILILAALLTIPAARRHRRTKKASVTGQVRGNSPARVLKTRVLPAAMILLSLTGYTRLLFENSFIRHMGFDNTLFTPFYMSRKDGLTTAFLMDLKYMTISEPEGYSAWEQEDILTSQPEEDPTITPNIIVIMDEAFSDPAVLGEFEVNEDYMPFFHQLQQGADNTVTGTLYVSVKGGNTANTEYEYLTGNSMRFLPGGSVPYQQYIFGPKDSLVTHLEDLGYTTTSIHPFNSTGWNRDQVYKYFGFDHSLFNSSFQNPNRVRKYIDDETCFQKIIEEYENKKKDTPIFTFAVTMQNHSGYFEDFDNFDVNIHATDCDSRILDRYLSLMKLTDTALKDLIGYFSAQQEPTIIVFFGDHQPNDVVIEPIWKLQGKSSKTLSDEDNARRYQVPYLIWANYDIEESRGTETSVNYLAGQTLTAARVPLSPFLTVQKTYAEELPIICTQRLSDADGNELTEETEEENPTLQAYRRMQYYRMFDE